MLTNKLKKKVSVNWGLGRACGDAWVTSCRPLSPPPTKGQRQPVRPTPILQYHSFFLKNANDKVKRDDSHVKPASYNNNFYPINMQYFFIIEGTLKWTLDHSSTIDISLQLARLPAWERLVRHPLLASLLAPWQLIELIASAVNFPSC